MDTQDLQRIKNKYDIIGNDAGLNIALETAVKVAGVDITVLISGESGVGKEVIPKIIHQNSKRKNAKYFAINCGAIPEGTIDAELFGHEKGSFTGAIEARKGYFEEANGGTLFLDEIGELPLASQAKLLRVLQSGEYMRVGSSKVNKTDVRVIAATNVNLEHAISKGKFRADLYYRLNAVQINMPALRDRKDDIYLLFRKFTSDFSEKNGRKKISLSNDAIALLSNYRWPGNIRQLKNIAERVAVLESPELSSNDTGRYEINARQLQVHMPKENLDSLPVLVHNNNDLHDNDKVKIFELLHSLSNEVNRLKKIVEASNLSMLNMQQEDDRIINIHNNILPPAKKDNIQDNPYHWDRNISQAIEIQRDDRIPNTNEDIDDQDNSTHEEPVSTDDLFSIKKNSLDLIKKALEKHDGNRRKAAKELGISERTLYRKLSQDPNHNEE